MKLIECYIENFGRISQKKINFTDGINCITGENGSGKTTLASFIKVMLYGMSDTKKMSLDENDRKRYLPWNGGVCGGSLTFTAGGKTYRAERKFAPKAADDSYTLYDVGTGRISDDFPEGLGEGLFGIDADGFERTVFLSERALSPKSDNKSISAKLSDLVGCDGDIGGMDTAMDVLEKWRKQYRKRGGGGELSDRQAEIDRLTRVLAELDITEQRVDCNYRRMLEISAQTEQLRIKGRQLLAKREDAVRRSAEVSYDKQYAEIDRALNEAIARRNSVAEIFGHEIPSHDDINAANLKSVEAQRLISESVENPRMRELEALAAKFDGRLSKETAEGAREAIRSLEKIKERESDPTLIKAKKIFAGRIPTEAEINRAEDNLDKKRSAISTVSIVIAILFLVVGVAGIFIDMLLCALGAVGVVASVCIGIAQRSASKRRAERELSEFFHSVCLVKPADRDGMRVALEDIRRHLPVMIARGGGEDTSEEEARLDALVSLFPEYCGRDKTRAAEEIIAEYDRYTDLAMAQRYMSRDNEEKTRRAERLRLEAEAFLKKYNALSPEPFAELRMALNEYQRLTAEIGARREEMSKLKNLRSLGEDAHRLALNELEVIKEECRSNDEQIAKLSREYALLEGCYIQDNDDLECRDEVLMRRDELREELEKHKDNYQTVMLTKEYITRAKDAMTSRYLGKTKAGFIKYTERIGGVTGESYEMDTDFGITKQEGATTRTTEAYSRGTRDLFDLSARLALVDSLYEKESPFIILDDPFTSFDDQRTKAALGVLSEFARDRQIIYFTCAKSRSV